MAKEIKKYFGQQKTKVRREAKNKISVIDKKELGFSLDEVVNIFMERVDLKEDVDSLSEYDNIFQNLGLIDYSYFHFPGSPMDWWENEGYYVFPTEKGQKLYDKIKGETDGT